MAWGEGFLVVRTQQPVSYTHLDVDKRQVQGGDKLVLTGANTSTGELKIARNSSEMCIRDSSNSDLAVHYYVVMALKSWYFAGKWPEYGVFLDKVAADAADDRDRSVRELASAWLNNLKRYTDQYERLKRLQDMPELSLIHI